MLLGLFFITVGMLLDWHILIEHWALVLALLVLPMLLKTASSSRWRAAPAPPRARRCARGLYLAQAGEFGFVLLTLTQTHGLVQPALLNPILAAMVLSMLATPFLIGYSNAIVKAGGQRLAAAVAADDDDCAQIHQHQPATSSSAATAVAARTWHACWSARAFPTWRWT